MTMKTHSRLVASAILLVALQPFLVSDTIAQGSLTPPGAPAPTMKTLAQIEPRMAITNLPCIISQSGSYYLTTNLTGSLGFDGITISANDVTLDLNGFMLAGVPGSGNGILIGPKSGLVVRNGTLQGWGISGIGASAATDCRYQEVRASDNVGRGIYAGNSCEINHCTANNNGLEGIAGGLSVTVVHSVAQNNAKEGITVSSDSRIADCTIKSNGNIGLVMGDRASLTDSAIVSNATVGVQTGEGCLVRSCVISDNGSDGLQTVANSRVEGCTIPNNTGVGILGIYGVNNPKTPGNGVGVADCMILSNPGGGISLGDQCTIHDCTVGQCPTSSGIALGSYGTVIACNVSGCSNGVTTGSSSHIRNCLVAGNSGNGILTANGSSVSECTSSQNRGDGIRAASGCGIINNTVYQSGLAGVRATSENHIRGNAVEYADSYSTNRDAAILLSGIANLVIENGVPHYYPVSTITSNDVGQYNYLESGGGTVYLYGNFIH